MEREYALACKLHPRFFLASNPARAEERQLVQEKAARILGGSGDSLTLFPSLDIGANSPRGPILATIGHGVGACPESPGGRAVLFLEGRGKEPIGYLDLGPEPADIAPILGKIGRLARGRGPAKVLLEGAEFREARLKSAPGEAPARQKRGWVGGFLRARLAMGDLSLKEGAPIALPTRSPGQERLVVFYSPGAGKTLQTALRETLPRVLKELKRFWGEKADAIARARFQETVRRHRRRTGLKVLGSLFEEARAPGGELIWKIAAEKRALAETVFDFSVLRTAVSPKAIGDEELCRLYRRRREISRETAALAGPLHLALWLKFFKRSWSVSQADKPENAPRGEGEGRVKNESPREGERSPLGPPREKFPEGSFLQERLYELLAF
jgi:hypothetical protein